MDKDYYKLPYTHEELLALLERINDLENLEGIQGPVGPQGPPGPAGKDADVSALQQEIEELKSTINELTQVPEIVIANKNIESEMEYLNERTQDENVIGIIVDPYIIFDNGNPPRYDSWEEMFKTAYNPKFSFICEYKIVNNKFRNIERIVTNIKEPMYDISTDRSLEIEYLSSFDISETNLIEFKTEMSVNYDFKTSSGERLVDISDTYSKKIIQDVFNDNTELKINFVFDMTYKSNMPFIRLIEKAYLTKIFLKK